MNPRQDPSGPSPEIEETQNVSPSRCTFRKRPAAIAFVVVGLLALIVVAPAAAAPILQVEISHSPSTMPRNDEMMRYLLKVKNVADPNAAPGDVLSCENSTSEWSGVPDEDHFTYAWLRNGAVIPGAGGTGPDHKTYTVTAADEGQGLQCLVEATNPAAEDTTTHTTLNATALAVSLPPVNVSPPPATLPPAPIGDPRKVDSRPQIRNLAGEGLVWDGETRVCHAPSNWTPGTTFSFQWLRNGVPIPGATLAEYVPDEAEDKAAVLQCEVIAATGSGTPPDGGAAVSVSSAESWIVSTSFHQGTRALNGYPFNPAAGLPVLAVNATSGEVRLELELPAGAETRAFGVVKPGQTASPEGWSCTAREPAPPAHGNVVCTRSDALSPQREYPGVEVLTTVGADAPNPIFATATVAGGGSAPASAEDEFEFGPPTPFEIVSLAAMASDPAGEDYTQAGGHPFSASVSLMTSKRVLAQGEPGSIGFLHSIRTDIPEGFIGNPAAIPQLCPTLDAVAAESFSDPTCPRQSIVGAATLFLGKQSPNHVEEVPQMPIFAVRPERGAPAQFVFFYKSIKASFSLIPRLRPEDGYAISIDSPAAPKSPALLGATVTLCGFGANVELGSLSIGSDATGVSGCKEADEAGANPQAFLTNPTECSGMPLVTRVSIDSWEEPGVFHSKEAFSPPVTGCEQVPFSPRVELRPTSHRADSPTGLDVSISVPTEGLETPASISQSALKEAVVTLPQGMSVNPSAADGLGACALSQIKLGTNDPVQCPESAKIGSAEVVTPLLAEHLDGNVYLAKQGDNPFHSLLALYLVVESKERGILVKIPGKVEADPQSGRLVATFDDNPQVPFSSLKLHFNEGNRAPLLNPPACGSYGIVSQLSPWSAPGQPRTNTSTFRVTEGPHGGPCPSGALEPKLEAGLQNPVAGTTSPFTLRLSREDGTQRFRALDVTMPPGLTAYLKGIPYCPDSALASVSDAEGTGRAQIEHPACPAASQIGTVSVGAGGGSNPFYVNTGRAYLAGPYKGAPLSIAIVTPAVAGPFDLGSVVVRSAVHVDPETARITVDSDPIPTILHGIPLDVRDIRVNIDRPHFTLAPTSCEAKAVAVRVTGEGGATASPTNHFQVGDCAALPFKPKLKLTLKGATGQAAHPALKAVVTYPAYSDTRCGPKGKRAKRLAAKARRERRRAGRLEGAAARRARRSARRDARQARRLRGEARRCLAAVGPEANIARAQVNLPHAEFLDQGNLNKVCRKPVLLAGDCPRSSVYGRARAWTPLLDHPLEGYVYLVGGYGYKLPALVAELNGQIKVLLVGKVDSGKNHGIRNTFEVVPDAPVSRFVLEMKGGKKYGLLQNSEDLCEAKKSNRRAIVRFTGHNGTVEQFKPVVANQCGKQRKAKKKHGRHGEAKAGGGGKKGKGKG